MDLYSLLGVARTASEAEIERAYRRLARRYHPGVNPGDRTSEEMYRQIQQAYTVLADAARRQEYDLGPRFEPAVEATVTLEGFNFAAAAEGPRAATFAELFADVFQQAAEEATAPSRGADIELGVTVAFRDAVRGADVAVSVTRQERCPGCAGRGRVQRPAAVCPRCGGAGSLRWARGHLVFTKACDGCRGEGRTDSEPCRTCAGVGTAPRTEVATLAIPAGIESGARVAAPGRGHAGARGGPTGDLYVTIDVAPHPHFRRQGRDLHLTLPVAVHEAALGAPVDVPTLDGSARLRLPPATASGQRFRLRGFGVGPGAGGAADEAGDLVVDVQIVLPSNLDAASRALLEQFGRLNPGNVRRALLDEA
jgi:molecular chaperone DnaJ